MSSTALRRAITVACLLGTVVTITVAAVVYMYGDRNAIGTLLLFAPRRFVPIVWLVIAVAIVWTSWRWALYALVWSAISLVVVADFRLPAISSAAQPAPTAAARGRDFRVVTFNVDYAREFGGQLALAVDEWQADVVLLQACGEEAATALRRAVAGSARAGKVGEFCIATRHPVLGVRTIGLPPESPGRPGQAFGTQFLLRVGNDTLSVVSVHLASPRDELSAALRGDWSRLGEASRVRRQQAARLSLALRDLRNPFILAGDFNVLPASTIYRRYLSHLHNVFHEAGWGFGFTMRAGVHRLRIDHVLLSDAFVARDVAVGRGWRTEHQPVVADVTY